MARVYAAELGELYAKLHTRLGADGLVDTSKYLRSLVATALIPDAELLVVHVVRDARGALHSRARLRRQRLEAGVHPRPGLASQAAMLASVDGATWLMSTALGPLLARRLGARQLSVSYRSFCDNPQGVLNRVASELGTPVNHSMDASGAIDLPPAHSAGGNADRFDSGPVTISEDTDWRHEQRGSERFVAGATWWLFRAAVGTAAGFGRLRRRVHKGLATVKP